ncbi:chaperone modulator CbpM [Hufsiella ginkgonis]|uniref:MerR family transcriptional regulator n=1 Tax=Hufsiella ginkgonis TaxID=2695274 RepID=A0A7K1Y1E5_9SPHI|nr:chaperone modulator CbpM [Hufsiella ginkgonis]MXV16496.1 MerR family transcriptional regulator [Hufsiella ginkgonis]
MKTGNFIQVRVFCTAHEIDPEFISSLQELGLLELVAENGPAVIPHHQLPSLERMTRLHRDLGINAAGIGALEQLLERMEQMREEMRVLKNRLSFYDTLL